MQEKEKYTSARLKQRKNGFLGVLSYKDENDRDKDGKPKWKQTAKMMKAAGKREAEKELQAWREEMEAEAAAKEFRQNPEETLAAYIRRYIDSRSTKIEPATITTYNGLLRRQIEPYIGSVPLDELQPDIVQEWVNKLSEKYSAETVRKAYVLLKSAMTQAVERDRLVKNPTRTVQIPKKKRNKPNALTERGRAQLIAFLGIAEPTPANLGIKLALYLGMREGEVCALRWRDVHEEEHYLEVNNALGYRGSTYYEKDPKTDGSARTIYYPENVAEALRSQRAAMAKACLAAGAPFSGDLFVIGGIRKGEFMHPHQLYRKWRAVADALELVGTESKPVTFHDLRHTFATAAINNGIDVKTVSSILGHANAAMTLNVYASADPDAKRRAAETMGRVLGSKSKETPVIELKTGTEG